MKVDTIEKDYQKTLIKVMREKTGLLAEIGPDLDKLDEWSILDHHNYLPHLWSAIGEYLWLLQHGRIPKDSKLALGIIEGRLIGGKKVDILPVKIAILPDNQMKVLESSSNSDILQAEIAATGTLPFRGKLLVLTISEKEVEVPDDLVPEGFRKCKECGKLFEIEGKRLFCSDKCRSRFHVRETRRRQKQNQP